LLGGKGTAKVSDFCLNATTPYWMSPKLLQEPSLKTTAADVCASGILLYEIYSKETPYEGKDVNSVLKEIVYPDISRRPPFPSTMKSGAVAMMHDYLLTCPEEPPSLAELPSRINRFQAQSGKWTSHGW